MPTNRRSTRGFLTFADQAMSSATNFALSFVALRFLPLAEFGSVGVVVLLYSMSLSVSRALVNVPVLIRYTDADSSEHQITLGNSTGGSLVIGVVLGTGIAAASGFADTTTAAAMVTLAVFLPMLLVQDSYRYGFFAEGHPVGALYLDTAWFALTIVPVAFVVAGDNPTVVTVVASWAGAGALAAATGAILTRTLPQPVTAGRWIVQQRDLGLPLLAEQTLGTGSRQAVLFFIAGFVGLGALGSIQGARTLFGPLNVLFLGSSSFVVPEVVRLHRHTPNRVRRFVFGGGLLLLLCSVAMGAILLLAPDQWMARLVGPNWLPVQTYVAPTAVATGAMGLIVAVRSGFRGLGMPTTSLRSTSVLAIFRVVLGVGATAVSGVLAGAYGLAVANSLGAMSFWRSFAAKTQNLHRQ